MDGTSSALSYQDAKQLDVWTPTHEVMYYLRQDAPEWAKNLT
jgi:hypothetical protein